MSGVRGDLTAANQQRATSTRLETASEMLEEFLPGVVEMIKKRQELQPKLMTVIDQCIKKNDTAGLKDVAPLVKAFFDEDKRVLDRVLGSAVQRSKSEAQVTTVVAQTSLRDLVRAQRGEL